MSVFYQSTTSLRDRLGVFNDRGDAVLVNSVVSGLNNTGRRGALVDLVVAAVSVLPDADLVGVA